MADEWWSSTSHRSHGASACSAAPLAVVTDRVACGWATSPTAAAESTSSITFQDPYKSSTHQPLSDAASSLGDPHVDWTQAFLSGRSDTSFQAVLQDDMVRAQPAADEAPAMNNPLIRDMSAGFLVDHAQLAPSPYGTAPSQQALFDGTAGHNISVYGDSQSSVSYDATASMQFSQLLKPSAPASGPMQGAAAAMQYLSGSYLPFGGPLQSQLLLQALQTKPGIRSSNANPLTVKDACSPAARKSAPESPAAAKRPRIEAPSPLPTFKVRKEKLGDRITALQQLVSPFGKTDTASVLHEAIEYIKFLHDQVSSLSSPYLKNGIPLQNLQQKGSEDAKDSGDTKQDLRSRGLCLVPVASTYTVAAETVPEFWHPTFGGTFR
ncbi:hypothetical protein GQ55_5G132500 [Panicum hallii var. hallii]|uniref:BHLH domain-containing protein n=1 Tax=Panicum hallii var. hallii TaxID=1504633 RepID=A0A2T7DFU2_9POAL|nr:hypothetical protein GQ55_5G132500 [Panicum hallii var. hallii]